MAGPEIAAGVALADKLTGSVLANVVKLAGDCHKSILAVQHQQYLKRTSLPADLLQLEELVNLYKPLVSVAAVQPQARISAELPALDLVLSTLERLELAMSNAQRELRKHEQQSKAGKLASSVWQTAYWSAFQQQLADACNRLDSWLPAHLEKKVQIGQLLDKLSSNWRDGVAKPDEPDILPQAMADAAIEHLNGPDRVVILSGLPSMGKTNLAKWLATEGVRDFTHSDLQASKGVALLEVKVSPCLNGRIPESQKPSAAKLQLDSMYPSRLIIVLRHDACAQ